MAAFESRNRLRVIGLVNPFDLRVTMSTEHGETPLQFPADPVPPAFRMPNVEMVRVIDHMSGREWLEDLEGKIIAILQEERAPQVKSAPGTSPPALKMPLKRLLDDLDRICERHEEVFDTDVREQMSAALRKVFVLPEAHARLPAEFGMFTPGGNAAVRKALVRLVEAAIPAAEQAAISPGQPRLDAFQDIDVQSRNGNTYDEYFGHLESL